jgi:glucan 1,3-beta-glucosidase
MYEYQLVNTQQIYMGQIQTESAYYQPNPPAPVPFPVVASLNDPTFPSGGSNMPGANVPNLASGWGVRIVSSKDILVYGAGLYSFFSNYNVHCSDQGNGEWCQTHILSIESSEGGVSMYNLNEVGVNQMITIDGIDSASYSDNQNGFVNSVALFRP